MPEQSGILQLIRENRTVFIFIGVGLLLIELEIFALAAMKSGREARLQVLGHQGQLIYEADGRQLTEFNRYYFEQTFGPLENYATQLVTSVVPFPFRAWFAAAVGVPVGAILLFGFAVRAYASLVYPETRARPAPESAPDESETRFERVIRKVSQFNIFVIGALTFLTALAIWMLPNMLTRIGTVGLETIVQYKWVVLGAVGVLLALVVWVIYLRYLLARKTIESQVEVDKFRIQLEMHPENRQALLLPPEQASTGAARQVTYDNASVEGKNSTDGNPA